MATLRVLALALALGYVLGGLPGCRKAAPAAQPSPPQVQPSRSAQPPEQFIVDRKTLVYHRPNCPALPPEELRVRIDRRMLEMTKSLHKPCEVCKPDGSPAAASEEAGPAPSVEGPGPPAPEPPEAP